ncbi:MAG: DoxX family membrane protein [Patescibacteria group bacterium]
MNIFPFRRYKEDFLVTILRFAVGSVFLWFGLDKWVHPGAWQAWFDLWIWPITLLGPSLVMFSIGSLELAMGFFFLSGRRPRVIAAAAAIYLILICLFAGVSDATVRDAGLIGGCLALFVSANQRSKQPVSQNWIAALTTTYILYLFAVGVLFLRHGP